MNAVHRELLEREIASARDLMRKTEYEDALRHLERAHILGQAYVRWHVVSHWLMLVLAVRCRQPMAALGQVARIVLGAIGSVVGRVPVGNTGGSDVSMFRSMPIPDELARAMEPREHDAFAGWPT